MKVPYSYLPRQFDNPDPILADIRSLVKEGNFTLGRPVEEFEEQFAEFIGTKYAVGVGSGTDALFLSLRTLDLQPGDEVITATNTFVATAGAIETAGAKIVFVDCNEKYVIDPTKIEAAITDKTRAILPVHYSGQPADMPAIEAIAKKHRLPIIEDACCAIDAEIDGRRCGTMGMTAAFSLHPLKNLNVWGDAGVITTNDKAIADKLRLMRNHGMKDRDTYEFYAYNSRLDTLQSIVGKHLLKDVKWITEKRIEVAKRFDDAFRPLEDLVVLPERTKGERPVYHMYMMLTKNRDKFYQYLLDQGIDAKIHYPVPLHLQPASAKLGYKKGDFPTAEFQAEHIVSLPVHQHLTEEEINYTVDTVQKYFKS